MWIDSFLQWLLISSLIGSVLTLIIFLGKIVIGRRMSAQWHYNIWFFLIIKLLLPFGPASSFSVFTVLAYLFEHIPVVEFAPVGSVVNAQRYLNSATNWRLDSARDYSISVSNNPHFFLLFLIWFAGVGVFSGYLILQNRNTIKLLRYKVLVKDEPILKLFDCCQKKLGIRGKIKLFYTDKIQIPMLFGVFTPSLLLPGNISELVSLEQLKYVFYHELAHYKRKDPFVNLGMCLLEIMHWFNPLLVFAFYQMRQEREAATDSLALAYLRTNEYQSYGATIIQFLSKIGSSKKLALGFLGDKINIKRRITNIAFYHHRNFLQRLLGGVLAIVVGWFVLTSSGLPQTDFYAKAVPNMAKLDLTNYFKGYEGSFVLLTQNKYAIYNETMARQRVSPVSTYKIYAALMGLENKVLRDADTEFKWDHTIYPFDVWNCNHNLRSAMTYSVNWYFERVNQQIGKDKILLGLRRMDYGNADISGGIKNFWIESSLKISPLEQVIVLKKLDTYELPFAQRSIDVVKDIIQLSPQNRRTLSGKTGTGAISQHNNRGWFVGYVGQTEQRYYFATYLQGSDADGKKAKEITLQILKSKQLF